MRLTAVIAVFALILPGCAGIRPAVGTGTSSIPVLTPTPVPVDTTAKPEAPKPATVPGPESPKPPEGPVRPDGMTFVKPTPVDELSLPEDALPPPPDSLNTAGFIPNAGPQAPGEEPPELENGWKVQVASYTDKQLVNAADADLKSKMQGLSVHLRYVDDKYILLVGNFIQRESADSLRDVLRGHGYADAFVVQAPVVAGPGGEKSDSSAVADSVKVDSSTVRTDSVATAVSQVPGVRIQVMSLSTDISAEQEARKAEVRTGMKAYVEEVDGAYKVHLGDFTDKLDANAQLGRLATLGYPGAFIVKATVTAKGK